MASNMISVLPFVYRTNVWRTRLTLRLIPSSEVEESAKKFEDHAFVKAKNSVFL